jgi:autotransporter adhesin
MNKVYKSVWNESIGAWVAVSENSPARGKRSPGLAKAAFASAMAFGAADEASATVTLDGGVVVTAPSGISNGVAIGAGSSANGDYGTATGPGAKATGVGDVAIGADSKANSGALTGDGGKLGSVAVGSNASATAASAASFGALANASGLQSTALGSHATASATASTAIGMNAVADRANTVSIGNSTTQRQLVQVARGTQTNDAVNVSQITPVLTALGGKSVLNADGSITAPAYSLKGTTYNNVGDALTALASSSGSASDKYLSANDADKSTAGASAIGAGSISIGGNSIADSTGASDAALAIGSDTRAVSKSTVVGPGATATASNTVVLGTYSIADRAGTVSVGSATNKRQIVNVAPGTQAADVVNVGQLSPVVNALGGKAAVNADGSIAAPAYSLKGTTYNNVGDALTALADSSGKYFHVNSSGVDSSATGTNAVAIGAESVSSGGNNTAIGHKAISSGSTESIAIGSDVQSTANDAISMGSQVVNAANASIVIGSNAVSLDSASNTSVLLAPDTGDVVNSSPKDVTTLGSFAVKYDAKPDGTPNTENVTLGGVGAAKPTKLTNLKIADLSATSTDAVNGSQLFGTNQRVGSLETFATNINNGGGIKYFHTNSKLADSSAAGADSVAIGGAANASADNAVALGSNSVADRVNSVSVGAAGKERQITNVEAGTQSTDAVNVSQLTAVSKDVTTLGSFAVKYDTKTDGTPDYERVTLGDAATKKPTLLTNLKNADLSADSTDAVNGSQLYATNQDVAALQGFTNNINNGGGITFFHTNSKLADSSATGADSVAIGGAAVSSGKNAVALGSNSVADRDNTVSVGAAGSERQVTNVAAGTAATDAANVGQLNAVSNNVTLLGASAIKYDTNADGTPDYANATLGNGNAAGTALHNVAAGTSGMDAVNVAQMNDMIGQVTNIANGAYNPLFTADGNRDTEVATSSGTHSVASGANAVASGANAIASGATSVASGSNAIAVGSSASANANNAVAVGANASATANNAVALGSGSVADRANSVSVGTTSPGGQRQVTNVAAGTDGTDAVNVNQMQQSVSSGVKSAKGYTDALRSDMNTGLSLANNHINSVGAMSSAMAMMAGSAAAVADKDNRFAAGTGVYRNKAAIAIGFQKRFGTNMVITVGGSTTGEESTGGAGFAFGF